MKPGDTVPIHNTQLAMSGNPRIQKIDKANTTATLSFEKSLKTLEKILSELKASTLQIIADRAGVTYTRSLSTDAPSSPEAGDMWFKTDLLTYWYYNGSIWVQVTPVP
jgi:hypothetical protein